MRTIALNNGIEMPQIGIGTFTATDEQTYSSVLAALQCGMRLVDTAHVYNNERAVGRAIKDSGVPREEIFVSSKLWPTEYGEEVTPAAIDEMLERLQLDYLDLLLLHQPFGDALGAWKAMEQAVTAGKVRALGISNFEEYKLDDLLAAATIKPAVHQVECHPFRQLRKLREKMAPYGTKVMCWYPFGGRGENGANEVMGNDVVAQVAAAHGCSPAQAVLAFEMQDDMIVIPGSFKPEHIAQNLAAADITLSESEMDALRGLNKEQRFFVAFESFTYEQAEAMILGQGC